MYNIILYYINSYYLLFVYVFRILDVHDVQVEYALWEKHGVRVVKKTLAALSKEAYLEKNRLMLSGEEISVVYFRAGYGPEDYCSELEWQARVMLERSLAVKCPSVDYQLVGAKKVQQALALPGAVERFLGSESGKLRECFAGLWGLGPQEERRLKRCSKSTRSTCKGYVSLCMNVGICRYRYVSIYVCW